MKHMNKCRECKSIFTDDFASCPQCHSILMKKIERKEFLKRMSSLKNDAGLMKLIKANRKTIGYSTKVMT